MKDKEPRTSIINRVFNIFSMKSTSDKLGLSYFIITNNCKEIMYGILIFLKGMLFISRKMQTDQTACNIYFITTGFGATGTGILVLNWIFPI